MFESIVDDCNTTRRSRTRESFKSYKSKRRTIRHNMLDGPPRPAPASHSPHLGQQADDEVATAAVCDVTFIGGDNSSAAGDETSLGSARRDTEASSRGDRACSARCCMPALHASAFRWFISVSLISARPV